MNFKITLIAGFVGLSAALGVAQTITFQDNNLKQGLIAQGVDTSGDNQIQIGEAEAVDSLSFIGQAIVSTVGLEHFVNLEYLTLRNPGWGGITEIDLSANTLISYLDLSNNKLEELNVAHLNLWHLDCRNNSTLATICVVDEPEAAVTPTFYKDPAAIWTEACTPLSIQGTETLELEIVKAYDLLGNELDPEGYYTGVIILEYNDGSKHRIYSSY